MKWFSEVHLKIDHWKCLKPPSKRVLTTLCGWNRCVSERQATASWILSAHRSASEQSSGFTAECNPVGAAAGRLRQETGRENDLQPEPLSTKSVIWRLLEIQQLFKMKMWNAVWKTGRQFVSWSLHGWERVAVKRLESIQSWCPKLLSRFCRDLLQEDSRQNVDEWTRGSVSTVIVPSHISSVT